LLDSTNSIFSHKEHEMSADATAVKAKDAVSAGADSVEGAINNAASKATEVTRKAKETASELIDEHRDAVAEALQSATETIRARPITSVAVVAAVAYLWGKLS
jgi:ElaB/YqjD/DUF883 family membrane-anchored ribosome-binding protein